MVVIILFKVIVEEATKSYVTTTSMLPPAIGFAFIK